MQPGPPSNPQSPPPKSRRSGGSGWIGGILLVLGLVYVIDHSGNGEAAVFGGVDRHISAQDFHGAQCMAIFGSCKIDLRDAQIQGHEAVLSTYAVFGGVEVRVPEDWEVVNHGLAIFGGMGDQRRHSSRSADTKTLILEGASVFGGVQVRN